jgi:hypothetical protein
MCCSEFISCANCTSSSAIKLSQKCAAVLKDFNAIAKLGFASLLSGTLSKVGSHQFCFPFSIDEYRSMPEIPNLQPVHAPRLRSSVTYLPFKL